MRQPFFAVLVFLALTSPWQTARRARPAEEWRRATPESQGVDSGVLADVIEGARQRGTPIHSLLVVRNGRLISEAYFHPYDGRTPHDIASVTKSITATLVGLAIEQGKIKSVKEPMLAFFPGRAITQADALKQRVTVEHLLTMSSGLACKAQAGEPTLWEMLGAPDNAQFMLDLPMTAEPGAKYVYCSGGMHLLSAMTAARTGLSAEAFARRHLFGPLGIRTLIWPRDPQSHSHGFGNLHLLPRDMAKLGLLFLNEGRWEGRPIVSPAWVAEATRSHIQTGGAGTSDYGYGWRVPPANAPAAFEASGRGGQAISVLKDRKTVIVFTGGGFNTGEMMKMILPAIKSEAALPDNPAAFARLQAAIAAAAKAPAEQPAAALPAMARAISGKTWAFEANWMGLQSLALTFREGSATAAFQFGPSLKQAQFGLEAKLGRRANFSESRPIGLKGAPILSGDGPMRLPVALKGNWEDERTFALEYDEIANTNTYRLRLTFDGDAVRVQAKERTGLFDETFGGATRRVH